MAQRDEGDGLGSVPFLAAAHPVEKLFLFLREGLDPPVVDLPEKVVHPLVVARAARVPWTRSCRCFEEASLPEGDGADGRLQIQQPERRPPSKVGEMGDAAAAGTDPEEEFNSRR